MDYGYSYFEWKVAYLKSEPVVHLDNYWQSTDLNHVNICSI